MQITTKRTGAVLHAALSGELDHHSAATVRQALDAALVDGVRELALDLSGVSFMDSSGIGVILGRYRILRARGGRMRLSAVSTYAARILKMAGILTLLGGEGSQKDGKRGKKVV
ncbi:MAG: STAS domain-containing protein [Candidatus Pelethousia sp.]|nr:STAS domain-containing protein [Candidatus Pelethousia sp.]